jgi:hypothetical protein
MTTNVINKTPADGSINKSDDSSMNMTGALITMMGKFLSTLNQSSMIQNAMICTERSVSLDMIANQSAMQVEEGTANATATLASGIGSIAGGVAAVGGGIAGVLGSAGQLAELSNLSEAGNIEEAGIAVNMNQEPETLEPVTEQEADVELDEFPSTKPATDTDSEGPVTPSDDDDVSSMTTEHSEDDDEIDDDITTQAKKSEMDKKLEQNTIKAKWERITNLHHVGQGFSGLSTGLGQALSSTFTTQAAAAQAAATKLGGLAQSTNSMMSGTESNYQSTLSLNTQLANEFQQFTAWWLASSKA